MFNSSLDTRYYIVDEDVWILLFPTNISPFLISLVGTPPGRT